MSDDPVTVTAESAIADAAALDARILDVTRQLAFVQAINPNERDDVGFSNSDYPAGFALAAAGRVEECASLLLLYPRQSQEAGLSLEALADRASLRVQGGLDGGARNLSKEERETARGQLRMARARVAGQLYWIETGDGEVLFNGVGLTARTRTALSGLTRTPTGWRATISPVVLHRFLDRLGDEASTVLDRFDALKALAGERPATMEPPRPAKPTTTVLSARVVGTQVALDWTLPFSDEGKALKDVVKAWGARWDGDNRRWMLPAGELAHAAYAGMLVPGVYLSEDLQRVTASLDAAVCSSIEQRVALLRQGLTLMEIVHETEDAFVLRSSSRHDGIYNLMRSEGFRWVAAQTGYQVPRDQLPIAVTKLQALDGVDTSSLTERALREAERLVVRAEAHDATRAALQVLDVTPGGRTLYPHQKEAVAHLLDPAWPHGRLLNDGVGTGRRPPPPWRRT